MTRGLSEEREQALRATLAKLQDDHRDLDTSIAALEALGARDQLQITRLKRKKLRLKDEMAVIEDELLPDIIA